MCCLAEARLSLAQLSPSLSTCLMTAENLVTHVKSILPDEWKKKLGHITWNTQKWEHLGCEVVLGKVEITGEEYLLVLVEQ